MAAYLKLSENVKQVLECSICHEVYSEPRALPCLHTFCLKCLQDFGSHLGKHPGDTMPCPICRKEYLIPKDGFVALPKNFMIDTLVEGVHLFETVEEKSPCDACKANKHDGTTQIESAVNCCLECQQYLCDHCTKDHAFENLSKRHKTIALEFKPKTPELSVNECKVGHCLQHPEKQLDMYCHNCTLLIYHSCLAESHHSHNCRPAEKTVEEIQHVIDNEIDKVSEYMKEASSREEQLQKRKEGFLKEIEEKETTIIKRGPRDDQTQHLLEELASMKHHRLKEMNIEKDEVERHHATLENFKAFSTAIRSKGTPSYVLIMKFKDVLKKASELRQLHESWALQQASSSAVADLTTYGDKNTKANDFMNTNTSGLFKKSHSLFK